MYVIVVSSVLIHLFSIYVFYIKVLFTIYEYVFG